jgi:hypothetical protein
MNDQQFHERLLANPEDNTSDFLAALHDRPDREALRAEVRGFEQQLRHELLAVSAPPELRQKLLDPVALEAAGHGSRWFAAANADSFMRRALPVAACLLVALGIVWFNGLRSNAQLEQEIFDHVYREAAFLERDQVLALTQVNSLMGAIVGASFEPGAEMDQLEVTYADDCWIARHISFHLIMKGKKGAVSVMMIPNSPVSSEFGIGDERFQGLVTPTSGGNLVVIGEKQEAIREYQDLLSHNLHWEY